MTAAAQLVNRNTAGLRFRSERSENRLRAAAPILELCRRLARSLMRQHPAPSWIDRRGREARSRSRQGWTASFPCPSGNSSAPADALPARDLNSTSHDASNSLSERLNRSRCLSSPPRLSLGRA